MIDVEPGVALHCYVSDYLWPWERSRPVILQHGFARNGLFWTQWIPLLCGAHRIFRPDVRGFGMSSVPREAYVYDEETLVSDIVAILDHFRLEKVHWVGESSGGRLGLLLAKYAPERLVSLVLCDVPAYVAPNTTRANSIDTKKTSAAILKHGTREWNRLTLGRRLDLNRAGPELVEWFIAQIGEAPAEAAATYADFLDQLDLSPILSDLAIPTLLLGGELSPISADQQTGMASSIPGAQLHMVAGVGHGVSVLAADECVQEIRKFWRTLD
jgi:3-oxoadipate enol-lactonase